MYFQIGVSLLCVQHLNILFWNILYLIHWIIVRTSKGFVPEVISFFNFNSTEAFCYDINGNKVKHGDPFVPEGNDFCYHCKCLSGQAAQCFTTECAVPTCEDYKAIPGKCCAYTCPSG